jgi:hypothetical protein
MFFSGVCIDLFISGMGGSAAVLGYILGHMETGALHLLAGLRFCCERERERERERSVDHSRLLGLLQKIYCTCHNHMIFRGSDW